MVIKNKNGAEEDKILSMAKEAVAELSIQGEAEEDLQLILECCFWLEGMLIKMRDRVFQYSDRAKRPNTNLEIKSFLPSIVRFENDVYRVFDKAVHQLQESQEAGGEENIDYRFPIVHG